METLEQKSARLAAIPARAMKPQDAGDAMVLTLCELTPGSNDDRLGPLLDAAFDTLKARADEELKGDLLGLIAWSPLAGRVLAYLRGEELAA